MSVEIVKDIEKSTWATNSYRFSEYNDKFSEAGVATVTVNVAETIGIVPKVVKNISSTIQEQPLGIFDNYEKVLHKIIPQVISLVDVVANRKVAVRTIYEMLGIKETPMKRITLTPFDERFVITDAIIRACEGVLSDLHIMNTPIDFDKFMEVARTPALFNPFMDFKVGEYEYKDAIVKVQLSTTTQETYPSLVGCTMHVDIPDTDDRGTVQITNTSSATKVYFNKFYYNPPEVIVVLRGGNSSDGMITPNIVSTDGSDSEGRYFEVELLDSYGNRKAGSISWTSKGY